MKKANLMTNRMRGTMTTSSCCDHSISHHRVTFLTLLFVTCFLFGGCESSSTAPALVDDFRDSSISDLHNLGWMGAKAHPLNNPLSFADPENLDANVSPGGIVLVEVVDDLPLANANLTSGDVVVRVAENWLPIKEDPSIDLIRAVEDQINANKQEIEIGYFRDGKFESAVLKTELKSLDEGLPIANPRIVVSSTAMLKQLAKLQSEDGSFKSNANNDWSTLVTTSMAGLAFLSADESVGDEFSENIDKCLSYVGQKLDDMTESSEGQTKLDPLTAAYVGLFLADSDIELMDEDWLERFGKTLEIFSSTQHESGGWMVTASNAKKEDSSKEQDSDEVVSGEDETDVESGNPPADVLGTFATNQVLLALGALERKGMSTENDLVEKGCAFLQEQSRVRVPSKIDRRAKAALSAGTAAALFALNCDRNDLTLKQHLKNAIERSHDVYTAPQLGLPGVLLTAIASRQSGNESWLQFHNTFKHLAVMLQNPDGSVAAVPNIDREPLEFESAVDGPAWTTAHIAMLLSMQSQELENLLALSTPPMMAARDSLGKKSTSTGSMAGKPGAQVLQLNAAGADAEELKKMIMEKLKEQGMEVDESKLKIKSGGSVEKDDE